jgi:hypothetical protein
LKKNKAIIIFLTVVLLVWAALYLITKPVPSRPNFTEEGLSQIFSTKSLELRKELEPIVHPQSFAQNRDGGATLRELTAAEKIIYDLAPRLWWHSKEEQAQADPLYFISQSDLYFWRGQKWLPGLPLEKTKIISSSNLTPKILAEKYNELSRPYEQSGLDHGLSGYYLEYGGPRSHTDKAPLFWRVSRHSATRGFQSTNPDSIVLLIEFWFSSVYNPIPIYLGSHQGDWEGFAYLIQFDWSRDKKSLSSKLLAAYLSEHRHGVWVCADKLERDSDNHRVNLYSALGTHATYSFAGTGHGGVLSDHMERGREWKTWEWLSPLQLEPYYGFAGAWGEVRVHWSMTGPLPPGPAKYFPTELKPNLPCQF